MDSSKNQSPQSLFDKIGGLSTLKKLVPIFYKKILDESDLNEYFQHKER